MKLRLGLLFLFCFIAQIGIGQTRFVGERLQKMLSVHPYHCDIELGKFEQYLMHDEVPIKLLFLSCESKSDSLFIKGRLADYSSEGMQANVFLAKITDTTCTMQQKLAVADVNGLFSIAVPKDKGLSLYFTSFAYQDLELKLSKLIELLE